MTSEADNRGAAPASPVPPQRPDVAYPASTGAPLAVYGYPAIDPRGSYFYGQGTPAPDGSGNESLNAVLLRYWRLFRRKWFLMLGCLLIGAAAGWYQFRTATPAYEAASQFELKLRRPRIMNQSDAVIDGSMGTAEAFNTYLEKLRRSELRALALEVLREKNPAVAATDVKLLETFSVTFRAVPSTRLVRVLVRHSKPELAVAFADAYAEAASRSLLEENRGVSENAVAWLKAQASGMRQAVEAADEKLLRLRTSSNIESLQAQQNALNQAVSTLNGQILELDAQASMEKEIIKVLNATEVTPEQASRLPDSARREALARSFEAYTAAVNERKGLLIRYTAKHPQVIAQDGIIVERKDEVQRSIAQTLTGAEANLALLNARMEALRGKQSAQSAEAEKVSLALIQAQMQLSTQEREREAADVSYRGILNRIEEARLAADENTASIEITEHARLPVTPIEPRAGRVMGTALMIALLVGIGLVVVTDFMQDYIWSASDVEKVVGARILGLIPYVKYNEREVLARACHREPNSLMAESFAGIRSVIATVYAEDQTRTLLVTSSAPKEGKTVCSTNLAIMFAKSGERTLLVDFDLRLPCLGRIFAVNDSKPNLLEALANRDPAAFAALPRPTEVANLHLITSRPQAGLNPAEVLASRFVQQFIEWARSNYERVIIDSPPFGAVSDSSVIVGMVDGVILVARERKSRRAALQRAVMNFRESGATVLGVIMNALHFEGGSYGMYSHYAYQHGEYYAEYRADTALQPADGAPAPAARAGGDAARQPA